MSMRLFDRADGVRGHYCIGRPIVKDGKATIFWEFYNKGRWCSAGQLYKSLESADAKMRHLQREESRHA